MNDYYVYEWVRLDTNEPFYVGIGRGDRYREARDTRRNKYFMRVYNKHEDDCVIHILHNNLTKEVACDYECWYINEYKYVIGYDMCNICDGGEGMAIAGENNPSNRKVICINTGEIYYSLRDAEYRTKVGYTGISQACNGKHGYAGIDADGNPLLWMYYDEYLENDCEYKTNFKEKKKTQPPVMKKNKKNSSGCIGVSWRKEKGKWRAYINIDGKTKSLGNFVNYEDAVNARKQAELEYYGEYINQDED